MKTTFFTLLLSLLVGAVLAKPNIVVVMPDDMGYGDLGTTGNPVIRTPNLDRLSKEGAELTSFYVSPVCSPTRASLVTGRYHHRTRVIDTFKGRSMMEPDEYTVAEALRDAGYATGIFGKWHLGDNYPMRPQDQGFDEVLVHRGGGLAQPSEPIENEGSYTDPILFRNGERVKTEGYCTDVYFDAAIEFMEESREAGKPFFVYLPPNAPHGPYDDVPEDLLEHYQSVDLTPVLNGNESENHRDRVARVFAMVENIDQNMGKLDAYLEESGQREDTLVIFFTDNGPNSPRYVGPFRGNKGGVHEGGIRTVFYARWPARLDAAASSDRIAAHIDVMPTLLDVAGAERPEGAPAPDGRSVLPLLEGRADDWPDRKLFFHAHRGDEPQLFRHFAVRTPDWKLVRATGFGNRKESYDTPFELYRIDEDPGESNDLAEERPEKLAELKEANREWLEDVSSTREDNYAPPRIVVGADAETRTDLSIQDWRVGDQRGWGDRGKWLVDVVDAGPYGAEVRWDEPIGEREVTLRVGDVAFDGKLAEGATRVSFPSVELPTGEVAVSVDISGEIDRGQVPRFVTLERE